MKVTVTAEHISKAHQLADSHYLRIESCPLALALKATFPYVCVTWGWAYVGAYDPHTENTALKMSRRAQSFINRFDDNKPVAPATFILKFKEVKSA